MDASVLIKSFTEFAKQKNVDRPTMIKILQDVFKAMIKKKFGHDENFDIVINADKGDLAIWRFRDIVDDNSEDIWDNDKISLTEAKKIENDFEIGEEVAEEIKRAGRGVPSAEFLSAWRSSKIQMQNAMLIASLDMKDEYSELVRNAPEGGELFERIRMRSLDA